MRNIEGRKKTTMSKLVTFFFKNVKFSDLKKRERPEIPNTHR